MIVLAAYVAVYLEGGNGWESDNIELKQVMYNGKCFKRPSSVWKFLVGRIGSVQLGLLCSISCIVYAGLKIYTSSQLLDLIGSGICIALAFVLYILIRIQTRDTLKLGSRRREYIKNLQSAVENEEKEQCLV